MVVFAHLKEALWRVCLVLYTFIISFIVVFSYREEFFLLFSSSFVDILDLLMFTGFGEVLRIYLLISILLSVLVSLGVLVITLYLFLIPGLYRSEMIKYLKVLSILFIFGFFVLYLIHFTFVSFICEYLVGYGYGDSLNIRFEPRFGEFVVFILKLDLIFLLVFMLLGAYLVYIWWVDVGLESLVRSRRWVYLSIITFIVIFLPADALLHFIVFSMLLAVYEILLFIYCIISVYRVNWKNNLN